VRQRPPHLHQPRHWWMLNCPRICRPTLSVERNRQLNGGQQWLPSTRCWLQKPSAISARRQRPWLVSACLACRTTSSIGKKWTKIAEKSRFRLFRFLAKNREFRFRIRESSITNGVATHGDMMICLWQTTILWILTRPKITRSSAVAKRLRNASCHWILVIQGHSFQRWSETLVEKCNFFLNPLAFNAPVRGVPVGVLPHRLVLKN